MKLRRERTEIVRFGKMLIAAGLTKGTGGNLSIYNRKHNLVAISPSGIDYYRIKPSDVPVVTIEKKNIEGSYKPSTELDMHMIFYNRRSDINALVHTHSVYASTIACIRDDIPPVHYLIACAGQNVRCADYAPFGTPELAISAFDAMIDRKAVLLANHGLLAGGVDLKEAFGIAEIIEYCAEIYWRTKIAGSSAYLSHNDMEIIIEKFKTYGK